MSTRDMMRVMSLERIFITLRQVLCWSIEGRDLRDLTPEVREQIVSCGWNMYEAANDAVRELENIFCKAAQGAEEWPENEVDTSM